MKNESKRILVIDDDPATVKIMERFCRNAGMEVIGALSGESGIKRAKEENPDLILLDIRLPDIEGPEVAKILKTDPATTNIPVIFITVTLDLEKDKGEETLDIDGCLYRIFAKPVHQQKVLSEIRKSINRRIHGNTFDIEGS